MTWPDPDVWLSKRNIQINSATLAADQINEGTLCNLNPLFLQPDQTFLFFASFFC